MATRNLYKNLIFLAVKSLLITTLSIARVSSSSGSNSAMDMLYEDMMFDYNKVVRPVKNSEDKLVIQFSAYLIHILDVDEKNQVLSNKLWLEFEWVDINLQWDPSQYGNITRLHVRSEDIWTPDVLLYNNADGNPQIRVYNDIMVNHKGIVQWKPPAIYKSFCEVDVTWFPYDEQHCEMKFGTWSYDGVYVDMTFAEGKNFSVLNAKDRQLQVLQHGMDLSYYYPNAEWDILNITAVRDEKVYPGCCGTSLYIDITFYFHIKRMTIFYTVNLLFPCLMISLLTVFVFYLPSGTGEKVTLCISILVTLSVFLLLLVDMMPATSVSVPLIGKYLLLEMILVSSSIVVTVFTQNLYFHDHSCQVRPWVRKLVLEHCARLFGVQQPNRNLPHARSCGVPEGFDDGTNRFWQQVPTFDCSTEADHQHWPDDGALDDEAPMDLGEYRLQLSELKMALENCAKESLEHNRNLINRALLNAQFIANHYKLQRRKRQISDEWSYLALVVDRMFLWTFLFVIFVGTCALLLQVPSLYYTRTPLQIPEPQKPLGYASALTKI